MSDIIYSSSPSSITVAEAIAIYAALGWGTLERYDAEVVARSFAGSTYVAIARGAEGELVGWVRALSDGAATTWIAELVVAPGHQHRGIGSGLMRMVIERFGETSIYLEAVGGSESFFERHGIVPRNGLVACSRAAE